MSVCDEPGIAQAKYSTAEIYFAQQCTGAGASLSYSLLLLLFFLLYSQLPLLMPALQVIRPVYAVGGAALLAVLVERMMSRQGWDVVWPESHLLLGFLAAAGLSCFGALWMRYAVQSTLDLLKAAVLYFIIINSINTTSHLRRLIWVMVVGGLFPAIGALNNYLEGNLIEGRSGWVGIFMNPNELAYSLVILIPLALYLTSDAAPQRVALLWVIIAVYIAAIYVSFSRGGMIGLVTVLAFAGLRGRRASTRALMLALFAASLALIAYGWSRQEGFSQLSTDTTIRQRLATIQAGLAMFADHPISGVGVGSSVIAWPLYAPPDAPSKKWLVIHNTFVQALSETGMLGFLCFTLLLGTALYDTRTMRRCDGPAGHAQANLATGLELSLWAFVVCGLSGGFALSWFPYIFIALVSSLKRLTEGSLQAASVEY